MDNEIFCRVIIPIYLKYTARNSLMKILNLLTKIITWDMFSKPFYRSINTLCISIVFTRDLHWYQA